MTKKDANTAIDLSLEQELDQEYTAIRKLFTAETISDTPISQREKEIRQIAIALFRSFSGPDQRDEALFSIEVDDCRWVTERWLDKAEKLFEFAGGADNAKRFIRMLLVVDYPSAYNIVDRL